MKFIKSLFWVIIIVLANLPLESNAQNNAVLKDWQFREVGTTKWNTATVPGEVHTDLLNNKLIPDPFYRDNEKKLQWIEKKTGSIKLHFP